MNLILQMSAVSKHYGDKTVTDNISLTLKQGEIYGLIGKNGSGKTSLLKLIAGFSKPSQGVIRYGKDQLKLSATIEQAGLMPELTAYEHLKAKGILVAATEADILSCIELVGLTEAMDRKVKNYSMGMKQRLAIGLALVGQPDLILFDEPTNGLDPQGIKWFRETVVSLNQVYGMTFIISSHILYELSRFATHFGFIDEGCLIASLDNEKLQAEVHGSYNALEDFYLNLLEERGGKNA